MKLLEVDKDREAKYLEGIEQKKLREEKEHAEQIQYHRLRKQYEHEELIHISCSCGAEIAAAICDFKFESWDVDWGYMAPSHIHEEVIRCPRCNNRHMRKHHRTSETFEDYKARTQNHNDKP
jgi:hypothetical protein